MILFRIGRIKYRGLGVGFGICVWISLFWDVAPVRSLAEDDVGLFGVGIGSRRDSERHGGGWRIFVWLGHFIRKGLRLGIGILAGISLFWAVAPVRDLA